MNVDFDFPLGLRPWRSELFRSRPAFCEGYTFGLLEDATDTYRFTIMIGATRMIPLLRDLVTLLPDEAFLLLEFYREEQTDKDAEQCEPEVYYSPYLPTEELMDTLEGYLPRILHDGFVGFGLANNRAGMEIFYSEEKVLTCFIDNHIRVTNLLRQHAVPHTVELAFPTDWGHDHLSLLCHKRRDLPDELVDYSDTELDYMKFCVDLADDLDMYKVEEGMSFFLSKREQDEIELRLRNHPDFEHFAEEDFGGLLLDWNDFVSECEAAFEGGLEEYRYGLRLRDLIQYVVEGVPEAVRLKIEEIVGEADQMFRQNLTDCRKRLDPADDIPVVGEQFWYHGMVRNQGVTLRRDLIRKGWFRG